VLGLQVGTTMPSFPKEYLLLQVNANEYPMKLSLLQLVAVEHVQILF
jgi:hypothetical protein